MSERSLEKNRAYDSIVGLISNGEISENDALSERRLSERLGLGRTPIREAIKDLVRDGVLESHPTRGTALKALDLAELQDLYEIRFALEGLAAFLAAERGMVEELEPNRDLLAKAIADPGALPLEELHAIGVDSHYRIIHLSGNDHLERMYRPFRIRFGMPFMLTPQNSAARIGEAAHEHLEILLAVMDRKPEKARDLICRHLQRGLDHRTSLLLRRSSYPLLTAGIPPPAIPLPTK